MKNKEAQKRLEQLERDNAALAERLAKLEADSGTKTNYNENVKHIPNYHPYFRPNTWFPYVGQPVWIDWTRTPQPYPWNRIYCTSTGTSIDSNSSTSSNNAL